MIETRNLSSWLPAHCGVAGLAGLPERTQVGITMARAACVAILHHIACVGIWRFRGQMAIRAGHGLVAPRERETSLTVVESRRRLPCIEVVALRTFLAKLAAVLIFVAGGARGREPKECPGWIFDPNRLQLLG